MGQQKERTYLAIDLKSFYASVECAERQLNPLTTNLVVADMSRTEKTICLAVTPSLKAYGISGRARLFEVVQRVREINDARRAAAPGRSFVSASFDAEALAQDPALELSYITATPRMQLYMDYSTRIYNIYLQYVAPEDIHVYSIDEVFMDVTPYLALYGMTARELCMTMIREILLKTGITATGGIGTNLYLAKVAMDIVAKHVPADENGVRIAELDEYSYRRELWTHEPLSDFWHVGRGYVKKLHAQKLYTMGDIALCSLGISPYAPEAPEGEDPYYNQELLYKLFGVRAEVLIDHAWGLEPVTIESIKAYQPQSSSVSTGQVLHEPYPWDKALLIVKEMTDLLVLDLVKKGLVTNQIVLSVGYDRQGSEGYTGPLAQDHYGRILPKQSHGSVNLGVYTASTQMIIEKTTELFRSIVNPTLMVRRVTICAGSVLRESELPERTGGWEQLNLFAEEEAEPQAGEDPERERRLQEAILTIQGKFGKNAILKGMNYQEGARTIERNREVGGHKA